MSEMPKIVCIGGANMDIKFKVHAPVVYGSSNPVKTSTTWGGVARNIAENLARLDVPVRLISRVGLDNFGDSVLNRLNLFQIDSTGVTRSTQFPTATYNAFIDMSGEMILAAADMEIYNELTPSLIELQWKEIPNANEVEIVVVDSNLPQASLEYLAGRLPPQVQIWATPVSIPKVNRFSSVLHRLRGVIFNRNELAALMGRAATHPVQIKELCFELHDQGVATVIVTCGSEGAVLSHGREFGFFKLNRPSKILDVTGAGDAFSSGVLFGVQKGCPMSECVRYGFSSAHLTLQTDSTVSPMLSPATLLQEAPFAYDEVQMM
jgi:pseudouridine kinase